MKKEKSEEDKELLQIRIETLQTMIGKMKENRFEIKTRTPVKASSYVPTQRSLNNYGFNKSIHKSISNAELKNAIHRFKWVKTNCCEKKLDIHKSNISSSLLTPNEFGISGVDRNSSRSYSDKQCIKVPPDYTPLKCITKENSIKETKSQKLTKASNSSFNESNEPRNKNLIEQLVPTKVVWVRTTAKNPVKDCYTKYSPGNLPNQNTLFKKSAFPIIQKGNQIKKQSQHLLSKYKFVRNKQCPPLISNITNHTMSRSICERKFIWRRKSSEKVENSISKQKLHQRDSFIVKRFQAVKRNRDTLYRLSTSQHIQSKKHRPKNKEIILTRHGFNFKLASNLKSLTRVNVTAAGVHLTTKQLPTTYQRPMVQKTSKLYLASCVLKKTINRAQRQKKGEKTYCLFYTRFGKCKRGDKCHYVHDPEKVAVCTRFLRGTCKDENCIFSHKFDPNKMPVCSYFLLGQCTREKCPYRHVNVSSSAPICEAFVKGFCSHGEKCTKKHTLECEEFSRTGICSSRKSCRLVHRVNVKKKSNRTMSVSGLRRPKAFLQNNSNDRLAEMGSDLGILSPLKDSGRALLLPSFLNHKFKSDLVGSGNKASTSSVRSLFASEFSTSSVSYKNDSMKSNMIDIDKQQGGTLKDLRQGSSEFIPLICTSDESDNESRDEPRYTKQFSFKEQDFISLE